MRHRLQRWTAWWMCMVLMVLWPITSSAQLWTATLPDAQGAMLALDRDNNAYVAGSTPTGGLLTKYSQTGAQLWQRSVNNLGDRQELSWVTIDPAGNAIVAGRFVDASGNPSGFLVAKYDAAGNLLTQDLLGPVAGYAVRAGTDAAGNVYVLGSAQVTNAVGNRTEDIVTMKIAPNGLREWLRTFGHTSTSADTPAAMAVTVAGNVIVTGGTPGQMLLVAYDVAGNQVWSKAIASSTPALDVAAGTSGEFYAVGGTGSPATGQAFLVVKHDANFNEIWRRTYAVGQSARRVAIDSMGNVIVTGTGTGAGSAYLDWSTIKIDPNGVLLWSRSYNQHAGNDEVPNSLTIGPGDSIYISGQGGPAPVSPSADPALLSAVTVRYTAGGAQAWSRTTPASVPGLAVRLASDGSVFVLGKAPQTLWNYGVDLSMNLPPTAVAAANPGTGSAPLPVAFSSAGSSDPDGFGTPLAYWWDFGDGQVSTVANPSHTYAVGTYAARLTVTDRGGAADTSAPITISVSAPQPTPTSLTLAASTVGGGSTTTATVRVSSTAGVTVVLSSSNSSVASVPASVTIPAGTSSATFAVKTSRVRTSTAVTIRATANAATTSATLTVLKK